jgi:hypothetical protein
MPPYPLSVEILGGLANTFSDTSHIYSKQRVKVGAVASFSARSWPMVFLKNDEGFDSISRKDLIPKANKEEIWKDLQFD